MTKPLFNPAQMTWIRAMASDTPPVWPGFAKLTKAQRVKLRKKGVPIPLLSHRSGKSFKPGAEHPDWKGDAATVKTGRVRAGRMYPIIGPCERCGVDKPTLRDRHHKDGNTLNNEPENIEILCRRCHQTIDGRREQLVARMKLLQPEAGRLGRESQRRKRDGEPPLIT